MADSERPIPEQMAQIRSRWQEIWWGMSGGSKNEYERLCGTDVFEFWAIHDLWIDGKVKENKSREQQRGAAKK